MGLHRVGLPWGAQLWAHREYPSSFGRLPSLKGAAHGVTSEIVLSFFQALLPREKRPMQTVRRIALVTTLILAWALAGNDRAPLTLTVASDALAASRGSDDASKAPHELGALRVLTKVILYVKDNYVDPKRVRPKEMMIAALEAVEKTVPDVLVDGNAETGKLRVTANGKAKEFDISHVDSLWKMSFT